MTVLFQATDIVFKKISYITSQKPAVKERGLQLVTGGPEKVYINKENSRWS